MVLKGMWMMLHKSFPIGPVRFILALRGIFISNDLFLFFFCSFFFHLFFFFPFCQMTDSVTWLGLIQDGRAIWKLYLKDLRFSWLIVNWTCSWPIRNHPRLGPKKGESQIERNDQKMRFFLVGIHPQWTMTSQSWSFFWNIHSRKRIQHIWSEEANQRMIYIYLRNLLMTSINVMFLIKLTD